MTTIYVKLNESVSYGEVDPDDSWDRPDDSWSISIGNTAYLTAPSYPFNQVDTDEDIQPGDDVYLVVVTYGTGDTFGHSSGLKSFELATKDAGLAGRVRTAIQNGAHPEWYRKMYDIKMNLEEQRWLKKEFDLSYCWVGYFECLEDVDIKYVKVV